MLAPPQSHHVSLNGQPVRLLLWRPATPHPWPVVLRMHGATETAHDLPPQTADLLDAGIAVLSFSGRQHGERGPGLEAYRAWLRQDSPNRYLQTMTGTALDLIEAATWLRHHPDVDGGRLGLWGGSFGATCCLAAARFVRPQAIASVCGFASWEAVLSRKGVGLARPEDLARLTPQSRELVQRFDPALHAAELPPAAVLFVHGDDDSVVPPEGQRALYETLAPLYAGMPDRLAFLRHPGDHATPAWCEQTAVSWLRGHLSG